eukprot:1468394-Lingulodinium_polyedra.AAC.1
MALRGGREQLGRGHTRCALNRGKHRPWRTTNFETRSSCDLHDGLGEIKSVRSLLLHPCRCAAIRSPSLD